jgi:mediator of replication checkpoint protein 1
MPEWQSQEIVRDSQHAPIADSQTGDVILDFTQQGVTMGFGQTQSATQASEMPEPTQDMGFARASPLPNRFADAPPSTIDTVLVDEAESVKDTSPLVKPRGRLRRRKEVYAFSDDEAGNQDSDNEEEAEAHDGAEGDEVVDADFEISADAFDVMKTAALQKKANKTAMEFNKKKSEAKTLVQEQAEESEDEYAGLGGASDDDSANEEDAHALDDMLDDNTQHDADESKLAAFYADRARAQDEKHVEKLMKDITHGNLRRKRGADYELSDSDDDDGGAARRRMKRREFAKMRKALLEDEAVGKIGTSPSSRHHP